MDALPPPTPIRSASLRLAWLCLSGFSCLVGCGRVAFEPVTLDVGDMGEVGDVGAPDLGSDGDAGSVVDEGVDLVDDGVDLAPPDAGPLGDTACDDTYAGALFCSGAEAASLSDWDGLTTESGGTIEWSTSPTYRGAGAVRATISTGGGLAEKREGLGAGIGSGPIYARAYLYISSAAPISAEVSPIWLLPSAAPTTGLRFFITPTGLWTRFTSDFTGGMSTISRVYDTPLPRDRWVCVEMYLEVAPLGTYTLSLDGVPIIDAATVDTRLSGPIDHFAIGITESAAGETGGDLSFDEVVIDDAPIGCD